jgi:hypothetical protein
MISILPQSSTFLDTTTSECYFFLRITVFYLIKINSRQRLTKCLSCESPQQFAANVRVTGATTTCG